MTTKKGKVYLVGAGPGDPKLITVKGLQCIKESDVLVYDNLASRELIDQAKSGAELVFVGKWRGKHTLRQEQINELLVKNANQNLIVTRLKGGDGFIFGRGGEEAEFLYNNDIPFEIVPGITSAYGVPAYAGIPLTHRSIASSVLLLTGHEDPTKTESSIDWAKISTSTDTIVILMGVKNLDSIVKNLIQNGRDPNTPIALIRWGTTPRQEIVSGKLDNIVELANQNNIKPPAVTVIGNVVDLHKKLSWYEKKPLFGKRVVITRAKDQASKFANRIEELGGVTIEIPTIKLVQPDDPAPIDTAINDLRNNIFDWVIFTSANAVNMLADRLKDQGLSMDLLKDTKIAVIGKSTALCVKALGLRPDFIPDNFVAESAVEGFLKIVDKKARVLLPRAQIARNIIPDTLKAYGLQVYVAPVYKNIPIDSIEAHTLKELFDKGADYITFTSSSTAKNFFELISKYDLQQVVEKAQIASIGPITSRTIQSMGFKVSIEAKEYTTEGLVEVITGDMPGNIYE